LDVRINFWCRIDFQKNIWCISIFSIDVEKLCEILANSVMWGLYHSLGICWKSVQKHDSVESDSIWTNSFPPLQLWRCHCFLKVLGKSNILTIFGNFSNRPWPPPYFVAVVWEPWYLSIIVHLVQYLNLKVFSDTWFLNFFILLIWPIFLIFVLANLFFSHFFEGKIDDISIFWDNQYRIDIE